MKIGYARVSTDEQNLDLQYQALDEAGCDTIYCDKASGSDNDRPGLAELLGRCQPGDMLVVWKLDRLGRSLIDLVGLVETLNKKQTGLRVLSGHGAMIDTSRPEGRFILGIFAALAEFERELIRERTKAGMEAARKRGVRIGRPRKVGDEQIQQVRAIIETGQESLADAAARLGVHPVTLRRALRALR